MLGEQRHSSLSICWRPHDTAPAPATKASVLQQRTGLAVAILFRTDMSQRTALVQNPGSALPYFDAHAVRATQKHSRHDTTSRAHGI